MERKPRALLDSRRESNRRDTVERSAVCWLACPSLLADRRGRVSRKGLGSGAGALTHGGRKPELPAEQGWWLGEARRPSEPRLCLWIPNLWTRPDNEQRERKLQIVWEAAERHGKTRRRSLAVSPVTLRTYCESLLLHLQGALRGVGVMVSGVCLARGPPATVRGPHPAHCLWAKNGFHIS